VSIQSLILVPNPCFNEPGYERDIGTAKGEAMSEGYNSTIRKATIRWAMIEQLRHPPRGFVEPVKLHFKLRRDFILGQVKRWVAEDEPRSLAFLNTAEAAPEAARTKATDPAAAGGQVVGIPRFGGGGLGPLGRLVLDLENLLAAL